MRKKCSCSFLVRCLFVLLPTSGTFSGAVAESHDLDIEMQALLEVEFDQNLMVLDSLPRSAARNPRSDLCEILAFRPANVYVPA